MRGRTRASLRLVGSALTATASVLALVVGAPAVSAEDVAPSPVDGPAAMAGSEQVAPTIAVLPSTGLSRGQTVTMTGSGFTPGSSIGVAMCDDQVVDRSSCDLSTTQTGLSDDLGGFTLAYVVTDTVNGRSCVPTGCVIGMASVDAGFESPNPVGLGFAVASAATPDVTSAPAQVAVTAAASPDRAGGGMAAQATPTISVSPSSGLTNGQTVTITGSGFTPGSSVGVSMCDDPFVDGSSCDFSTAKIGSSDGAGGFSLTYQVVDTIHGHSCVPTGCLIGASNLNVANEFANRVSLGFGTGSTPTPEPTPSPPGATTPGPTGGSSGAGASATPTALANTGQSDSLPFIALAGFALVAVGAALTAAAKRARVMASA